LKKSPPEKTVKKILQSNVAGSKSIPVPVFDQHLVARVKKLLKNEIEAIRYRVNNNRKLHKNI
jgi:hypothetical protein